MKKIFTLLMASACLSSYGQALLGGRSTITGSLLNNVELPTTNSVASGFSDTLGLADFLQATPAVYLAGSAGYATGMVNSIDTFTVQGIPQPVVATTQYHAFSEGYLVNDDFNITGAMFFAGVVSSVSGNNPNITVLAQKLEENKAISDPSTVQNPDIPGPGATLASATVALEDVAIDPTGTALLPTFVDFASAPFTDLDFCVTVNIQGVYSGTPMDTIAVVSTADGEGDGEYTYHRVDQQAGALGGATIWAPTSAIIQATPGTGLNVNFAIFPIVSETGVGIEEQGFINGVRMTAYPSPALSTETIHIDFETRSSIEKATVRVYATNGQLVFSSDQSGRSAGQHTVMIPAGTLSSGSYVYSLEADGARVAKRMEILK